MRLRCLAMAGESVAWSLRGKWRARKCTSLGDTAAVRPLVGDDDPYNPSVAALYNKTTDHTGAECCGWCSGYVNCTAWSICVGCKAPFTDRCYLKTSTAGKRTSPGVISGLRAGTPKPPPPPADQANCIPWSLDPHNRNGTGFYWSANTCSMLLTSNDTLVACARQTVASVFVLVSV
jgi:hypothetical protein